MRREIAQALEIAALEKREQLQEPLEQNQEFAPGDYSHQLSSQQAFRLKESESMLGKLMQILKNRVSSSIVDIGTSTSLEIRSKEWEGNIVIELSMYAPLVAVFIYGSIAPSIINVVSECIADCSLLELTSEEIAQLEEQGTYHEIF